MLVLRVWNQILLRLCACMHGCACTSSHGCVNFILLELHLVGKLPFLASKDFGISSEWLFPMRSSLSYAINCLTFSYCSLLQSGPRICHSSPPSDYMIFPAGSSFLGLRHHHPTPGLFSNFSAFWVATKTKSNDTDTQNFTTGLTTELSPCAQEHEPLQKHLEVKKQEVGGKSRKIGAVTVPCGCGRENDVEDTTHGFGGRHLERKQGFVRHPSHCGD